MNEIGGEMIIGILYDTWSTLRYDFVFYVSFNLIADAHSAGPFVERYII